MCVVETQPFVLTHDPESRLLVQDRHSLHALNKKQGTTGETSNWGVTDEQRHEAQRKRKRRAPSKICTIWFGHHVVASAHNPNIDRRNDSGWHKIPRTETSSLAVFISSHRSTRTGATSGFSGSAHLHLPFAQLALPASAIDDDASRRPRTHRSRTASICSFRFNTPDALSRGHTYRKDAGQLRSFQAPLLSPPIIQFPDASSDQYRQPAPTIIAEGLCEINRLVDKQRRLRVCGHPLLG